MENGGIKNRSVWKGFMMFLEFFLGIVFNEIKPELDILI